MSASTNPESEEKNFKESKKNSFSYEDYDLDSLMSFAEELKKNCEIYADQIYDLTSKQTKSFIFLLCGIFSGIFFQFFFHAYVIIKVNPNADKNNLIYLIIFIMISMGFVFIIYNTDQQNKIKKIRKKILSEETALEKTVSLLREMGNIVAQKKGWNQLKQIEFQIRLSRFEIGRYSIPKSLQSSIFSQLFQAKK
ncbi:MAG: hypothetical protein MUD14_03615 [Hydrococcus sp. Prado102]|nr:hypothetical protein [Hydrococcus sp. Prado102]